MAKKHQKILALTIITVTLLVLFFSVAPFGRADDEERDEERKGEEREEEDYRPSFQVPLTPVKTLSIISNKPNGSAVLAPFKDSDQDGIPDLLDKHPGQDDFSFTLIDNNNNGIADDLEILLK